MLFGVESVWRNVAQGDVRASTMYRSADVCTIDEERGHGVRTAARESRWEGVRCVDKYRQPADMRQ